MHSQCVMPGREWAELRRANGMRGLAVPASALGADCRSDRDIDVRVGFEPDRMPGSLGVAGLEMELSALPGGREVDPGTPEGPGRHVRQDVPDAADLRHAQG